MNPFLETSVFLVAAIIAVAIARRLKLGTIIGYLAAGIFIGPTGLGLIEEIDAVMHFAEFGVLLLLFVIGLEIQPHKLWALRRHVFVAGPLQWLLSALLITPVVMAIGIAWNLALAIGLTLALSSTAFALQLLAEHGDLNTRHGRMGFGILLFQDLAVVPLLALLPFLALGTGGAAGIDVPSMLASLAILTAVLAGIHFLLPYLFRMVASAKIHEIFTALSLFVVVGMTVLMDYLNLFAGLGALLAGVLLAESGYRHQIRADIEPFRGLLLGLFFMAVGMTIQLDLIFREPGFILAGLCLLLVIKGLVLLLLAKFRGLNNQATLQLAALLCQGGEFAFVTLTALRQYNVLEDFQIQRFVLIIGLSMLLTPLLYSSRRSRKATSREVAMEQVSPQPVVIAGFGRFGERVAQVLATSKIPFVALDNASAHVDTVRRYGNEVYYGDPSRPELLRAAGMERVEHFVLAIDDVEASLATVRSVKQHYPHVRIYARALNIAHAGKLLALGVDYLEQDTFLPSLEIARHVLLGAGLPRGDADRTVEAFAEYDNARMVRQATAGAEPERIHLAAITRSANELARILHQWSE